MKIALIGYGKMGREIEKLALQAGHEVVLKITSKNQNELSTTTLQTADVAIEFTKPELAASHIKLCIDAGIPVISGTTGWNDTLEEMKLYCVKNNGTFFHASNFSIGVNVLFEINRKLASLMNEFPEYDVVMKEIHHTQKIDAPSGTAITLAEGILSELKRKSRWTKDKSHTNGNESAPTPLYIEAIRTDNIPGTHFVTYRSSYDQIQISHEAFSRIGFAGGALKAAEFALGKKGILGMRELLSL